MEALYYTLAAVILYFASDWILNRIELGLGKRLPYRSLVFFVILGSLAVATFALVRRILL